ncbi:MAG: recombinase family protein [Brevundimonas sp.]
MGEPAPRVVRCAIYTRKSSEEGLDQAYNSLDAQRDACEAYISSQQHEGWLLIETAYDDGGFSGGDMHRPGLAALLADIRAGLIDVVVVYKIDRLTRALLDFAKIVNILDEASASFVAVTQAFNTTTSMGRLTLNVLLSFAQFEREITGERIRDKFASTRAKGMWVGPVPAVGYDRENGLLVVNETEAAAVRTYFAQYLKLGSISAVVKYGIAHDLRVKPTRGRPAQHINHSGLCRLLVNPIYIGKLRHRGVLTPGLHKPIITPQAFERAGKMLAAHREALKAKRNDPPLYLLDGILRSPRGGTYQGRHHKSYARQSYHRPQGEQGRLKKINTASLDRAVLGGLCAYLDALRTSNSPDIARSLEWLAARLRCDVSARVRRLAHSVLDYVVLNDRAMTLTLRIRASALSGALSEDTDLTIAIALRGTANGAVLRADGCGRAPDMAMLKLLSRASAWFEEIASGRVASVGALARREQLSACYVGNVMELAFLAPDLKREILEGRHPVGLTAMTLRSLCPLPPCWRRQRILLEKAATAGSAMSRRELVALKGPMPIRRMPWMDPPTTGPRPDLSGSP